MFERWLKPLPLVAILRGLTPQEAAAVGAVLVEAGFRLLEVPLNSPAPLDSIGRLAEAFGRDCLIGAGTVTTVAEVAEVAAAGARLVVMPHVDGAVIGAAKSAGLVCVPGVATPSEAFAALAAGADALKAFPAEAISPAALRAWRAVLPPGTRILPVGGIAPETMRDYLRAGAAGFGIGTALYAPRRPPHEVALAARRFVAAWNTLSAEARLA